MNRLHFMFLLLALLLFVNPTVKSQGVAGYYRYPTLHESTIVFSAEGDLWSVQVQGGLATRITTHDEEELAPAISPDGSTLAFSASYEGPVEVYTIPIHGGIPTRWTYESDYSLVNCWSPDGRIVYDTRAYSTLPDRQLIRIDPASRNKERVPLSQASEASYDNTGKTVYFVRPAYHNNVTKRYMGGTARQIWKYTSGEEEAVQLTKEYAGESHHPMWYLGRVYFISDRDGIMNIWSMTDSGADLKQHSFHSEMDVRYASMYKDKIVYQLGADIWLLNTKDNSHHKINIRLQSDLRQMNEKWDTKPLDKLTAIHPDPKGERIVLTARGKVFVVPVDKGRIVSFTEKSNVRYRDAVFSADGKNIIALSDESKEFEFVKIPSNGIGKSAQLSSDGSVLRYAGVPSPDGKWIAYDDLQNHLFLLDVASGTSTLVSENEEGIGSFSWSPDSKWLAYMQTADNTMSQIFIYSLDENKSRPVTSDRANSSSPKWSPDGKFLYLLSDRNFTSLVGSPWGPRQPEPYFDARMKLYLIPLKPGFRSAFREEDEISLNKTTDKEDSDSSLSDLVKIDFEGILERLEEVPVKAGNYSDLALNNKAVFLSSRETGIEANTNLIALKIGNKDLAIHTVTENISGFSMSFNGEKLLVRKGSAYYMIDATAGKANDLNDNKIDLSRVKIPIDPLEDWKQIFTDAWRMERDYFYDKNMHGVNWDAMHTKYYALIDRVTTREELSDLIGQFVGELSALHTSVRGGDIREDNIDIIVASLGAELERSEPMGGYLIKYIYKADPDYPDEKSPLDDPFYNVNAGDIITAVNGKSALDCHDLGELLRDQANAQVLLSIKGPAGQRDIVVHPMRNSSDLRYRDWEYSRRLRVEAESDRQIGYVHLRAMSSGDLNQWYREFYPVFNRPGLIIDVRHNRGGNIESFILEKLLRKAWMYWKSRSGKPYWNMQYAFRGHIVILVDENTASDGEAFADGFKKLGLGVAIGKRTWGGEIWLSGVNTLSDGGIARAPMNGVYANGEWLIEGHGFEPDIEVDNYPHATFKGQDAQLDAAIKYLIEQIKRDPRELPDVPPFPDKSFKNK